MFYVRHVLQTGQQGRAPRAPVRGVRSVYYVARTGVIWVGGERNQRQDVIRVFATWWRWKRKTSRWTITHVSLSSAFSHIGTTVWVPIPCGTRLTVNATVTSCSSLLSNGYRKLLPRGQGHEADHWSPCSTEAKNACSYTSTPPHVFMMWYLIKHRIRIHDLVLKQRNNFTYNQLPAAEVLFQSPSSSCRLYGVDK